LTPTAAGEWFTEWVGICTVAAATLITASSPAVAGVVSAQAAMLMKGALKAMLIGKLKFAAALTLTAGLMLGATGLVFHLALTDKVGGESGCARQAGGRSSLGGAIRQDARPDQTSAW